MSHFINTLDLAKVTSVALATGWVQVEEGSFEVLRIATIPYGYKFDVGPESGSGGTLYGEIDHLLGVKVTP